MDDLGYLNNRKIIYQRHALDLNWSKAMLRNNWLLIVISDDSRKTILFEIANKAVVANACYISCIGKQAELLHDIIDEEIVFRQVDIGNLYLPPFDIITTYHANLDDGLWYAIYAADHSTEKIDSIVCLDASREPAKHEIETLINEWRQTR